MPTIKVPAGTDIYGEIPGDEWWNKTAKLNEYMLGRLEIPAIRERMWKDMQWSQRLHDEFSGLLVAKTSSEPVVYIQESES